MSLNPSYEGPTGSKDSSGSSHTTRSTRINQEQSEYSSGSTRPTTLGNTSAHTDIQSTTMPRTPWKTPAESSSETPKYFTSTDSNYGSIQQQESLLLSSPAALGTALETRSENSIGSMKSGSTTPQTNDLLPYSSVSSISSCQPNHMVVCLYFVMTS